MNSFKQTRNFWKGLEKNKIVSSLNMNGIQPIAPPALTNSQRTAVKPKYNAHYLKAKVARGNLTKNNRNKVRQQQLMNYVATSNNPSGKRAAVNQLNQLMDGRRKTRRH
jgi:hypothetical protein